MCLCEPNQAQKTLHLHSRVGGGRGKGGVCCGGSSFDNSTFSTGLLQIHHGRAVSLKDPALEGREAEARWAGRWGGYLHDASSQLKTESAVHYLLSLKYQNKEI
jgi:hypothetical protein